MPDLKKEGARSPSKSMATSFVVIEPESLGGAPRSVGIHGTKEMCDEAPADRAP